MQVSNDEYAKKAKKLLLGIYLKDELQEIVTNVINDYFGDYNNKVTQDVICRQLDKQLKVLQYNGTIYQYNIDTVVLFDEFDRTLRLQVQEYVDSNIISINTTLP